MFVMFSLTFLCLFVCIEAYFSVMSGRSQRFLGLTSIVESNIVLLVGIEPRTSRF